MPPPTPFRPPPRPRKPSLRRPLPPPEPGAHLVNALPPTVLALFLVIGAVEAALSLADAGFLGGRGGIGWRVRTVEAVAVSPVVQDLVLAGDRGAALLSRYVLYPFVHGGAVHALFAGALLLALGKFVGEAIGHAVLLVFAAACVVGGLTFGVFASGAQPLYGAYPGVYGLIGAFTYLQWLRLGQLGENQLMAFRLIGGLLAIQLLFGLLFGADPSWIGDLGGFAGGLAVAPLAAPGGLRALRDRLRR
jgi:membrane associated rhomboid family serine protease